MVARYAGSVVEVEPDLAAAALAGCLPVIGT